MNYKQIGIQGLSEYIQYSILKELYLKNKENFEKESLVTKVKAKFEEIYSKDINDESTINKSIINVYVVPEGTDITEVYLSKIKETCNSVGINALVNPDINEPTPKDDFVIFTEKEYIKPNMEAANPHSFILLSHPQISSSLEADALLFQHKLRNDITMAIIIEKGSNTYENLLSRMSFNTLFMEIPDAPKLFNKNNLLIEQALEEFRKANPPEVVTDNIQNIREKLNPTSSTNNKNKPE